jgi:hypothetical protein
MLRSVDAESAHLERQAEQLVTRQLHARQAAKDYGVVYPYGETPEASPRSTSGATAGIQGAEVPPLPPVDDEAAIKADFKVFLTLLWRHLGLPDPTPIQLSIADYLQHGPRSAVIMAFRGAAKSWITAAFALWTLYCNPQAKVMVVSGSMKRAVQFTTFCLALVRDMPLLKHLEPRRDQRQSATSFDVGQARPAQSSSLSAFGITGQIVGQRADLIVGDDVETNTNSMTVMMREKLAAAIREFDAILVPNGRVKFLGTPQTNDSIYNKLPKRGYEVRIWPFEYPNAKRIAQYGALLSPFIRNRSAGNEGKCTEPSRFTQEEMDRIKLSWGTSGYDLQYMLDTSLADVSRYPLKVQNLIVMSLDRYKGPDEVVWGRSDETILESLQPLGGFPGDRFYRPQAVGPTFRAWNSVKAWIDPSDVGNDETALGIGAELNGRLFGLHFQGWVDGASPKTMLEIARLLVKFRVNEVTIETNFGGTMFGQLLRPILMSEWAHENAERDKRNRNAKPGEVLEHGGTSIIEEKAQRVQKELRIIADLEPATQSHRIVIAQEAIEFDIDEVMRRADGDTKDRYSLIYQYTNLTRERQSLTHDDRLETLSGLAQLYRDVLGVNPSAMAHRRQAEDDDELFEAELRDAIELGQGSAPKDAAHGGPLRGRSVDPRERRR